MAKTQEELIQLKQEYETLNSKLKELTEDELKLVTGGCYAAQVENYVQQAEQQAQEATNNVQELNNSIPQLVNDIDRQQRQRYTNTERVYRCKVCETVSLDWNTILDHVKNAHNGESSMVETIEF